MQNAKLKIGISHLFFFAGLDEIIWIFSTTSMQYDIFGGKHGFYHSNFNNIWSIRLNEKLIFSKHAKAFKTKLIV